jgi:hypothetical protein
MLRRCLNNCTTTFCPLILVHPSTPIIFGAGTFDGIVLSGIVTAYLA